MTQSKFASKKAQAKWKRDVAIFNEFNELTKDPTASKGEVTRYLMAKYGLFSETTIWSIRKNVERILAEEA